MDENRILQEFMKTMGEVDFAVDEEIDLTNCDREPIHIPGHIQPHGFLLALKEPELTVLQVSDNLPQLVGLALEQILNQNLELILGQTQMEQLRETLNLDNIRSANPLKLAIDRNGQKEHFNGILHRYDDVLFLELEPVPVAEVDPFRLFFFSFQGAIERLNRADDINQLCQITAEEVRQITGYDRVMVYRFDKDWHGEVIAETRRSDLEPYLGLHYPASDIPVQARALYRANPMRIIVDVDYEPAAVVPTDNPLHRRPLDMSFTTLRSVSPLHLEYLRNMGVGGSMSISLIKDGELWGLIACHHTSAKYLPYEMRTACLLWGQITALQISAREKNDRLAYAAQIKEIETNLSNQLLAADSLVETLLQHETELLGMIEAGGAALYLDNELTLLGATPDHSQTTALIEWLDQKMTGELYTTDTLLADYPPAVAFKQAASGLLAMHLSREERDYLIWFRPEVVETVYWAGDPAQPAIVEGQDEAGHLRLSPRKSFETWKQIVEGVPRPWRPCELEVAQNLGRVINRLLLRQALIALNGELERSNAELDAFAYIASHDLKEPLRGIHNYADFLLEDYHRILDEPGQHKLQTLVRLSERMEELINALLHYSRVGRVDLAMRETNLTELVERTLEMLDTKLAETGAEIRIPRPLPTLKCDFVRVGEIFNNLITNALKYNDKAEKVVEIGYIAPAEQSEAQQHKAGAAVPIFYVRDNGIGIRERHHENVFLIFKRLHGRDKYGGGTGAGLTIVKKIVERHKGTIWLESTYGEGTIFYFTLQGAV